jgi:hypothetical protein
MIEDFTNWLSRPFAEDQSATRWFMFVGLILVSLVMWGVIIHDIRLKERIE